MNIDITDPNLYLHDPYPTYRWLRENAPIYRDEKNGLWVVSRHADVCAVSKDAELWSAVPSVLIDGDAAVSIVCMDNPRHQRLRKMINRGFTPRMVKTLEGTVRQILEDRFCKIEHCVEFDLVEEISIPVPMFIIAEMIGISKDDYDKFHHWSDTLIASTGAAGDPEIMARSGAAYVEYGAYLAHVFEDRRANPRNDLVSILVNAASGRDLGEDEEALEAGELVMFMTLLLVAGNETTRNAISGGLHALLENPDQKQLLLDRPELISSAVEEILRYISPITAFRRNATRDTEIHGQKVEKGEKVVMLYQSANRDPAVFDDPDAFDITRSPNPHLALGIGNHFCLGANLARMEIRVVIEELLKRMPDIQMAEGAEPVRVASNLFRGIDEMRLTRPSLQV
jgi:cytochrome P450